MLAIRQKLGSARLFTVGIGAAPNGHFLRNAARMGRGTFTYIGSINEVESKMTGLLNKLTHPVLTDIELSWPAGAAPEYAPASGATDDSIRQSVLPLALQYQLVSNYTSLVAVDRTPARPEGESLRSQRIPNTKPNGLDWPAEGVPSTATPAQLNFTIGALLLLVALGWHLRVRRVARS